MLAHEAASQLGLDRVILVPTGEAPHKVIDPEPGVEVRLDMAQLAADGDDLVEASDVEVRREGPSYTFRTLELLRDEWPGDELTLLMGSDVAASLESWKEPRRVLELAQVAVAARPGTIIDEAEAVLERLGDEDGAKVIRMPGLDVSSTRIRRRVAARRPIRYLVPDAIEEFISERGLYS